MMSALRQHTVTTQDGARLRAYVQEPAEATDDAPTVVLAHGWTLGHESWHRVVEHLDGVRVVLWDQRGHGGSTFADGSRRPASESIKRLGQDAREVIAALVPEASRIVLGGHSMGGMTAMAYAGTASDAEIARLLGVVLVSTAASDLRGTGLPGEAALMKALARMPARLHLGPLARAGRQRTFLFGPGAREEDVQLTAQLLGRVPLAAYGGFYPALMAHNETASLGRLAHTPVDVFVGTRDRLTPRRLSTAIAQALPDATLHVMPDRGHMLPFEEAQAVAEAIRADLGRADLGR